MGTPVEPAYDLGRRKESPRVRIEYLIFSAAYIVAENEFLIPKVHFSISDYRMSPDLTLGIPLFGLRCYRKLTFWCPPLGVASIRITLPSPSPKR